MLPNIINIVIVIIAKSMGIGIIHLIFQSYCSVRFEMGEKAFTFSGLFKTKNLHNLTNQCYFNKFNSINKYI